ncbi:hypothetical protein K438DRAFT_1957860 [Mycena galopus ATCC 62051]|nr:hypothetical protein K438DRAFT_1957860 [Mycena galopus ATCC 62051]
MAVSDPNLFVNEGTECCSSKHFQTPKAKDFDLFGPNTTGRKPSASVESDHSSRAPGFCKEQVPDSEPFPAFVCPRRYLKTVQHFHLRAHGKFRACTPTPGRTHTFLSTLEWTPASVERVLKAPDSSCCFTIVVSPSMVSLHFFAGCKTAPLNYPLQAKADLKDVEMAALSVFELQPYDVPLEARTLAPPVGTPSQTPSRPPLEEGRTTGPREGRIVQVAIVMDEAPAFASGPAMNFYNNFNEDSDVVTTLGHIQENILTGKTSPLDVLIIMSAYHVSRVLPSLHIIAKCSVLIKTLRLGFQLVLTMASGSGENSKSPIMPTFAVPYRSTHAGGIQPSRPFSGRRGHSIGRRLSSRWGSRGRLQSGTTGQHISNSSDEPTEDEQHKRQPKPSREPLIPLSRPPMMHNRSGSSSGGPLSPPRSATASRMVRNSLSAYSVFAAA